MGGQREAQEEVRAVGCYCGTLRFEKCFHIVFVVGFVWQESHDVMFQVVG